MQRPRQCLCVCGLTERCSTDLWEITRPLSLSHGLKLKPRKPNPLCSLLLLCHTLSHACLFVSQDLEQLVSPLLLSQCQSGHLTVKHYAVTLGQQGLHYLPCRSGWSTMNLNLKVCRVWFETGAAWNVNQQLVEQPNQTAEQFLADRAAVMSSM